MYILQDYIYQLPKASPELADNKDTIFINSEDIFFFHKVYVGLVCIDCAIDQLRYIRPQYEALGNNYRVCGVYSLERRAEVYCVRLNFNISKLVYS